LAKLGIEPVALKIDDVKRLCETVADCHTVLLTIAPGRRDGGYRETYYQGVVNLLEAARGTCVEHVIYTSSTGVYGQRDGRWVDEESATASVTANSRILREAELRLLEGARIEGITGTILRLAGIYGPSRGPARRVRQYAGQERSGGDAFVNLVHRDDVVSVLTAAIDKPFHGVFNVSDGHPIRRRTLYGRVLSLAGLEPISWVESQPDPDLGKRVRNDRVKRVFCVELKYPHALQSPEFGEGES
jgi:nucleoside-diphosphate-sugar epimerase